MFSLPYSMKTKFSLPAILKSIHNCRQTQINSVQFFEDNQFQESLSNSQNQNSSVVFTVQKEDLVRMINESVKTCKHFGRTMDKLEQYLKVNEQNLNIVEANNQKLMTEYK
ncbi:Hypothetical_protein [Hexamita inflata]|uniref:Hypothetical_protein n=1 Tax=Hexamita inflata TaxID=28002 RepID=A0AA86VH97_9EUKA|nr:Hypothetical protein HINF_LOCUS54258 [Hexamita inflata]